jgi:hypothetical protein
MDQYRGWKDIEQSQITPVETTDLEGRLQEAAPARDQLETAARNQENQIDVKGFEQSGVMRNEEVRNYLADNLPANHLRGDRITQIQYTDRFDGDHEGNTLGVCTTNPATGVSDIQINRQTPEGSMDRHMMEHTLVHEVGHNVFYNMGEHNISTWEQISANSAPDGYVSNYARTNMREDFAESYAAYVQDPALLQEVNPQKYAFLKQSAFGGREYGY